MKKLFALICTTLLLVGCSDARVKPSNDEMLFKVNDVTVTSQDLFAVMKLSDAGTSLISQAASVITKDVKDASIDEKVSVQLESLKEYFELMEQDFEAYLKTMGYESEQQYIEETLYPQYALNFLVEEKITADFATLSTEYQPIKARILEVKSENGDKALERIKNGESFDDVAKDLAKESTTYKGTTQVYTIKGATFPTPVSTFVTTQKTPGLSTVLTTEGSASSYIVEIVETQSDRFKDEAIDVLLQNSTLTQTYIAKLYKENGFKVYDKDIYEALQTDYKDYLSN